jgi:hypothetical protein
MNHPETTSEKEKKGKKLKQVVVIQSTSTSNGTQSSRTPKIKLEWIG